MKTYIIAEIGINHNGDINVAKQLIDVAKDCGCDAVKFQKRNPDKAIPESEKGVVKETPWGLLPRIEYKKKLEFGADEFDQINSHCEEVDIKWSASPWDEDSIAFLLNYDLPWVKVASAIFGNRRLCKLIADGWGNIIASTGMSEEDDVRAGYAVLRNGGENKVSLLHCVGSYPAPPSELNLRVIQWLADTFVCPVGYSGHEVGLWPSLVAVGMGATIIERHITLDRAMWGTDQSASVEPQGLKKLVGCIRDAEVYLGDGHKVITPSELPHIKKLRGTIS